MLGVGPSMAQVEDIEDTFILLKPDKSQRAGGIRRGNILK
jgi:hypothetical protein